MHPLSLGEPAAGIPDHLASLSDPQRLRALASTRLLDTPVESAFDRLTELAALTLGVPIATVSLITGDRQFFKSQCGLPAAAAEARGTPLSHSVCQFVVSDRRALVIADTLADARVAENLAVTELGLRAYAGIPLVADGGEVIGSFCAMDLEAHEWSDHDVAVLEALAAATMEVVGLRSEALAAGGIGQRLQAALVPEAPQLSVGEAATLYRPGERHLLVGGDFYLCSDMPDGWIGILIGDVAGHGPEAAAFAASLRSAWGAMLLSAGSIEEYVARLNSVALAQQPSGDVFATALACWISPARDELLACSAGHPAPIVVDEGVAREVDIPRGLPLGVSTRATWRRGSAAIGPGASTLVYTDGLIEGRREAGCEGRLGTPRVVAKLQELYDGGLRGTELLGALADFALEANGGPLPDDVAALLVAAG